MMSSVVSAKIKRAVESSSEVYDLRANCENVCVKVQTTGSRPLLIGTNCKPHERDPDSFQEFARSPDLAAKLNCHTWILGDFILPKLVWTTRDQTLTTLFNLQGMH